MDAIWTQQGQPPLVRARVRRCEPWARHSLHLCTYDLRLRAALHWHELLFSGSYTLVIRHFPHRPDRARRDPSTGGSICNDALGLGGFPRRIAIGGVDSGASVITARLVKWLLSASIPRQLAENRKLIDHTFNTNMLVGGCVARESNPEPTD